MDQSEALGVGHAGETVPPQPGMHPTAPPTKQDNEDALLREEVTTRLEGLRSSGVPVEVMGGVKVEDIVTQVRERLWKLEIPVTRRFVVQIREAVGVVIGQLLSARRTHPESSPATAFF